MCSCFAGKKLRTARKSDESSISSQAMQNILINLTRHHNRKSTNANYVSIWKKFNAFMIKLDWRLDFWEDRVVLYCAYLIDQGTQSQTVHSYVCAIKSILANDGYDWNDSRAAVRTLARACKIKNDTVHTRLPIHSSLLEVLLFELDRAFSTQVYLRLMYQAMLAIGYYGLLRIGELTLSQHTIKAKDIHVGQNKDKIMIVLYSSKTHDEGSIPQKIKISSLKDQADNSNRLLLILRNYFSAHSI